MSLSISLPVPLALSLSIHAALVPVADTKRHIHTQAFLAQILPSSNCPQALP